jgi:di/tricarboxylate transporter
MTLEMMLTLGILFIAIIFFVTEIIRADLVGLMVLVALVLVGLVTPVESIAGFANPAVVTIWAVFILSEGLARTGVASKLGEQVLRLAGRGESRLIAVLMSSTAVLSGFMNNIGVAAMFLPVTVDMARRTGKSTSLLLMPMAYGALFGGMLVLIGTSSNLVVSDFLRDAGMRPLGFFDFTPIGVVILAVAVGYMALLGRHMLPQRKTPSVESVEPERDFRKQYELKERLAKLTIPEGSPLSGKTLGESRFGRALGLNVLSIRGEKGTRNIPDPGLTLEAGDTLLVLGRLDVIDELSGSPVILFDDDPPDISHLIAEDIGLAELEITEESGLIGKTSIELDARQALGINILAIRHEDQVQLTRLRDIEFQPGDRILLQGPFDRLESLRDREKLRFLEAVEAEEYNIDDRLLFIRIPDDSALAGKSISDVRLATSYGASILKIIRGEEKIMMPGPDSVIEAGDLLVVRGRAVDIEVLHGHQTLVIDRNPALDLMDLETDSLKVVEVMLSPYTSLAGRTLSQINFREKFGITVLAIWRGDRPYRTNFANMPLEFGDALLCYGPPERFKILGDEPDFIVLNLDYQEKVRLDRAVPAGLIMLGVILTVLLGWLPIYVAAIAGSCLMILTRCLSIDEAYRAIEWKAVFLIATMLPLGFAMQRTGAAEMIAEAVIDVVGSFGPVAILGGIMTLTLLINQFIPSAVNAVVMTPIALATAAGLGISPYPLVMGIAYAVASSFMAPVSHPVNVIIMSPGGYRFGDYVKNGFPLSLIVLIVSILLLPVIFPF